MMTRLLVPLAALPLLLSGCGKDNDALPATETPAVAVQVQVTPSLGRITNGVLELRTPGGELLASGSTGTSGVASFTLPTGFNSSYVVRVCGNGSASYFDEALLAEAPLAETDCLRAVVADARRTEVAVTMLTEAVARRLEADGGLAAASAPDILAATEMVRSRLAPELEDILDAPALVASAVDLDNLPGTGAGLHALRLSLFARAAADLAATRGGVTAAPALDVGRALADDLSDGLLDGQVAGVFIFSPVHDVYSLDSRLQSALQDFAAEAGALQVLADQLAGHALLGEVLLPPPGDAQLSWRGSYSGIWQLGGDASTAQDFSSSFPQDYQGFLAQLVEGGPCLVSVSDGGVSVSGLGFSYDYRLTELQNESGQRQFQHVRTDTATAPFVGAFPVTTTVTLVVQDGVMQRIEFLGAGSVLFFSLTATAACVAPPG